MDILAAPLSAIAKGSPTLLGQLMSRAVDQSPVGRSKRDDRLR